MKKVLFTLFIALTVSISVTTAQNIALGERVPELKVSAWLGDQEPTAIAPLTYVEFFLSSNKACITSLKQLLALTDKLGTKLDIVVVTHERVDKITPLLEGYLSTQLSVALDTDSKIFTAFGVRYVPFGVLLDNKNRALWMGNSLQLTTEIIEKSSK